MRTALRLVATIVLVVGLLAAAVVVYARSTGLSARSQPSTVETRVARLVRSLAVPSSVKALSNPVPASAEVLGEGLAHYADHCASCHANDGSGDTETGRGLFPKAPDMRLPATQGLSDGELFHLIEHGIRFTGMPGWSTGTPAGEVSTWQLVQFIRHLPNLTDDELARMETLNPRSPEEIRQQIEAERFLAGGD